MTTLVYVYGSGECDQLGLGDDAPSEVKKARKPQMELSPGVPLLKPIVQIACGGMHTVALASNGVLLSWGCNDDGALGREGAENTPLRVDGALNVPVDGIAVGDCHTIAYNTQANKVFYWGCYKNMVTGKSSQKFSQPIRIGQEIFGAKTRTRVKKICSGAQHTLALTQCGKVYGWGDAECGKIGRLLTTRNKNQQAMKIETVGAKNAEDIFCGNHHSFYINKKKQVFSWGMNNHGQLGLGNRLNTAAPTRIRDLDPYEGDYVVSIAGGEHHTIAHTRDGVVYCFGRNDEGQIGLGDLYGEYRQKKKLEQAAEAEREAEAKRKAEEDAVNAPAEEQKPEEAPVAEEAAEEVPKKRGARKVKKEEEKPKDDELKYIGYFYRPHAVTDLWKFELEEGDEAEVCQKQISHVAAGGQYSYCVEGKTNKVYSWGFGENYVLGTLKDDNECTPHNVNPKMYEENKVHQIALGTQHVVALATLPGQVLPSLNLSEFELAPGAVAPADDEDGASARVSIKGKGSARGSVNGEKAHGLPFSLSQGSIRRNGADAQPASQGAAHEAPEMPLEQAEEQKASESKKRDILQFQSSQPAAQPADSQTPDKRLRQEQDIVAQSQMAPTQAPDFSFAPAQDAQMQQAAPIDMIQKQAEAPLEPAEKATIDFDMSNLAADAETDVRPQAAAPTEPATDAMATAEPAGPKLGE